MTHENTPLVSVIIPVYKVEKYLDECIQSVCKQTYTNLEIILVDDGSPDRCGAICDEYGSKDERIKVIHKGNEGVAKARNTGLQYATGEYIFFVDSDDYVTKNAIEFMLMVAKEKSADMVCASDCCVDENGRMLENRMAASNEIVSMGTQEALHYYAPKEWAPWNRLIKAEIHHGIEFPNYKIHEDEAIKFKLLERCKKVVNIAAVTYIYRQRANSITSGTEVDRMDMFYSRYENLCFLKKNHPDVCELFIRNVCDDALFNLGNLCRKGLSAETEKCIAEITAFAKENLKLILWNHRCTITQKVRIFIAVISNWKNPKCFYKRFYAMVDKVMGRC